MKRALRMTVAAMCALLFARVDADAQHWTKVLQFDSTFGASGYFFNANEGLIGTGSYFDGIPAQIYYTNDGGATWKLARFLNPNIRGQVTDIYFHDRLHGWATIREYSETGWSGIYRSTDGGETWRRARQAGFPISIRETGRGVYYTDQANDPGVFFSSDTGRTWIHIATTEEANGIDFMDDSTGFVTSRATSVFCPHLYTTNGGQTWESINSSSESWTPYADPISRSFFLASEIDQLTFTTQTTVVKVPVGNWGESKIRDYGDSALTGGIAGSHVCQSIIYVQGRFPASIGPNGIIRTMDAGFTWTFVGGPNNVNDKRFAVAGRGAVVMACDDSGGVWRTVDGGDGALSPSVLRSVSLTAPIDTVKTTLCDSVKIPIILGYHLCDSVQIVSAKFLNDSLGELSVPKYDNDFRYFTSSRTDTLNILYRPAHPETWSALIQLTIRQPDGYTEDTILRIPLLASTPPKDPLVFSGNAVHDTLDFDSVSICADAFQSVTMTNLGCGDLIIDSIAAIGLPFLLISNFQPFVLSHGNSRSFLIHYVPSSVGRNRAALYVKNSSGLDSVILLGTGYSSGDAVSLLAPDSIRSSECDSAQFVITLRDIACKAFAIDSIITNAPFRAEPLPTLDSVQPAGIVELPFVFVPNTLGNDTGTVHLVISYAGTGRYDTTITIIGNGVGGQPVFHISSDSLPMGFVPICLDASDTLVIFSSGCAGVTVQAAFDSTNGFSIVRGPKPILPSPSSDTVIVAFHPNNSTGRKTANLIFTTSAGIDTVPVSITVIPGGGTVTYSTTPDIQAYTCQSQPFSLSISDSLCDSITIDSIALRGVDAGDFSLADTVPIELAAKGQIVLNGVFTPQDSLARSASIALKIREADGTSHDTTIALAGLGIPVPLIEVALGVTSLHTGAGQNVTIPILAKRGSTTNLGIFDCSLLMNTDLLSPLATNTNGFFGNAGTQSLTISRASDGSHFDTVQIHFQSSANALLPVGELCEIACEAYVTSATSTGIVLHSVEFHDAGGSEQCLSSETVPDTNAVFMLDQVCGDTSLSQWFRTRALALDGVSPNPTTGLVRLTFEVPQHYTNITSLELYNALGEKLGEHQIVFPEGVTGRQSVDLDLNTETAYKGERILYLRVRTPTGFLIAKVIVLPSE